MFKKREYLFAFLSLAELICIGLVWIQYDWMLYLLSALILFQISYSVFVQIKNRAKTKICQLCSMHIVVWYRICPNCGYIFEPGCKKDELTDMIEDALEKEEIHDFDGTEYPVDRVEQIEMEAVENYVKSP